MNRQHRMCHSSSHSLQPVKASPGKPVEPRGRTVARQAALLVCVLAALAASGCSRTFWRRQADLDAYALVREKATHPHWRLPNYSISIDPRSRMYDPYQVDCPPIPQDDPTAHAFMHCVDNKRGWPFWHENGERPYVENPAWPEYVTLDDRGVLKLDRNDAVRLALIHSRDYQQQLEVLYLSALDVSVERFAFDTQFFAGYSTFGEWVGRARSGAARVTGLGGDSSSNFATTTFNNRGGGVSSGAPGSLGGGNWSARKQFTTGSSLLVNFANSLLWQFSGPDEFTGRTFIDFTMVQPLLRNAGRDRAMETLTLFERVLLYNVRLLEQYRQAFYVDTLTGFGTNNLTLARRGGVQGQGAAGFQGVGGGGFGNVQTTGGGGGTNPQGAGNFIGLLQQQRLIRNQEDAIRRLRRNLFRLNTLLEEQPADVTQDYLTQALQVAQTRQALLNNETNLVNTRNTYYAQLDTFKINELSLPPQICVEPTDPLLNPFDLIEQEIIRLPEDWEAVLVKHVETRGVIPERIQNSIVPTGNPPVCRLNRYEELPADLAKLRPAFADMQQFAETIVREHLPTIRQDLDKMRDAIPRRKAYLERLIARIRASHDNPCDLLPLNVDPLETASGGQTAGGLIGRLDTAMANAESSYENLSTNFRRYAEALAQREKLLEQLSADNTLSPEELFEQLVRRVFNPQYECGRTRVLTIDVVEDMTREMIELQLLQAVARAETIEVNEIDIRADAALEVARRYRRDWMNRRATLVDQWRLLQFNADQLQAGLDVIFAGDLTNVGDNPFNLRSKTGRLVAGVQFDAPLTRLTQRNAYRQSLIEYQQARRNYYFFEDTIATSLRAQLRQITQFQIGFELNRMGVLEAARQVMLNTFIDQEAQRAATTRVTAARDVVQALTDLLNAQNQFMLTFISYEVARLQLDFNLGTMQLDDEGLWIDPGKIGPDYGEFDPWLWRTPGGMPASDGEIAPGAGGKTEELPPAFMLPQVPADKLPPAR